MGSRNVNVLSHVTVLVVAIVLCLKGYTSFWHWEDWWAGDSVTADRFFCGDYYDARALFRRAVRALGAELHHLPIEVDDHDLTIDVAVIPGDKDSLILHVSGTHGVEGFAGSAIQSAILSDKNALLSGDGKVGKRPTVVLVHALNPFGFAKLRRWNENNVDLNRNHLSPEEFDDRRSLDPNRHGYEDFMNFFNPPAALTWTDFYFLKAGWYIAFNGYVNLKKCVVSGTYHHPNGIFYGGSELQTSHKILRQFLTDHLDLANVRQAVILDIHTGLGPTGFDTIIVDHQLQKQLLSILGGGEEAKNRVASFGNKNSAMSGYEDVVGDTTHGIRRSFREDALVLPITQEFGTVPGTLVAKALREENAAFNHAPWNRMAAAENVRDVFYLRKNSRWKASVVTRGTALFWAMYKHLQERQLE